jgi:hypothetical protein
MEELLAKRAVLADRIEAANIALDDMAEEGIVDISTADWLIRAERQMEKLNKAIQVMEYTVQSSYSGVQSREMDPGVSRGR